MAFPSVYAVLLALRIVRLRGDPPTSLRRHKERSVGAVRPEPTRVSSIHLIGDAVGRLVSCVIQTNPVLGLLRGGRSEQGEARARPARARPAAVRAITVDLPQEMPRRMWHHCPASARRQLLRPRSRPGASQHQLMRRQSRLRKICVARICRCSTRRFRRKRGPGSALLRGSRWERSPEPPDDGPRPPKGRSAGESSRGPTTEATATAP